jgi:PAS domain S-box-containing protein
VIPDPDERLADPGLAKTALIRELVDLSRFTDGILRTLGSAVISVDEEGQITFVNPAAESLLGLPAGRLLRRPVDEVLVAQGGESLLSAAPAGHAGEVDLVLPDGRLATVEVRLSRQDDAQGGVVAILTDRTDLKRAEAQARRKERLASLGELSAGVAHEIRNPLAGIGASAQLLRQRLAGDRENLRLVDMILEEVSRLDRIVESLLSFARPAQPSFRRESVIPSLERALKLIEDEASHGGVTVNARWPDDLPPLWIDPDQMLQVLLNLLRNALQAMDEHGGNLTVAVRRVSRPVWVRRDGGRRQEDRGRFTAGDGPMADWLEIEITDTGHGIPREAQERIFNPFYTTRRRGTGLGLSITQGIVHEHGGSITVSRAGGRGTPAMCTPP